MTMPQATADWNLELDQSNEQCHRTICLVDCKERFGVKIILHHHFGGDTQTRHGDVTAV